MKSTEFHPSDYDAHGRLRLPFLFWCVLLLQARTWVLFVIAGSSREQGSTLLNLFYPDHDAFWLGLLPGVPAVLAFLLSGRRFVFPVVWRWLRGLLILAQLALLCWQPVMWLAGEPINGVGLAVLVADVVALIWLLTNQRLRACFSLEKE
ncbi:Inner membrane protein yfeZ [Citrobacter freundii]|nr:Inner membrane protein yfeZ [Citrobacter freundii]